MENRSLPEGFTLSRVALIRDECSRAGSIRHVGLGVREGFPSAVELSYMTSPPCKLQKGAL